MQDFTQWREIGRGAERVCYQHPHDRVRCIKVSPKDKAKQTRREIAYFEFLLKRNVPFTFIPHFYAVVQTEQYIGIEQELVLDNLGNIPPNLHQYLSQPLSARQQQAFWQAMANLKDYLIQYNIIPCDLVTSNMLVIEEEQQTKVMMIDGFGAAEWLPIANYLRCVGKRKIERKWDLFIQRYLMPYF